MEQIKYIKVTNRNPFTLTDRHNNVVFEFPSGVEKVIPLEAAEHIFGFSATASEDETMTHCIKRFGYNNPKAMQEGAHIRFWNQLEIRPVLYRMVEELVEPEPVRAPPIARKWGKRGRTRKYQPRESATPEVAAADPTGEAV